MKQVSTAVNDKEIAEKIARKLVEAHAAASVHIQEIKSVFEWKGEIKEITEWTINALCEDIDTARRIIREIHPYELPAFVVSDVNADDETRAWCRHWCDIDS